MRRAVVGVFAAAAILAGLSAPAATAGAWTDSVSFRGEVTLAEPAASAGPEDLLDELEAASAGPEAALDELEAASAENVGGVVDTDAPAGTTEP